jgi:hypothetical protein
VRSYRYGGSHEAKEKEPSFCPPQEACRALCRSRCEHCPSDIAFWLSWPPGDEAWAWINAVAAADQHDPAPLLQLLAQGRVPERVMPYVADLLNRKLGKEKSKPGRKPLLWKPPVLEALSIIVDRLIKNDGFSVDAAVERVIDEFSSICSFFSVSRDKLIAHYTGKSGYGRRWKKKRSAIKKVRSGRAP